MKIPNRILNRELKQINTRNKNKNKMENIEEVSFFFALTNSFS